MNKSIVIIFFLLWIASFIGWGCFLNFLIKKIVKNLNINKEIRILYYGVVGLIFISVFGTILNFFIPLDSYISLILLIPGLFLFLFFIKDIFLDFNLFEFIIIVIIGLYCSFFPLMNLINYDTGLYHLSSINWITNSRLPFGLANLHYRLGFNSSWFINASLAQVPNFLIGVRYFIINSIIVFFYGSFIFLNSYKIIKNKDIKTSSLFAVFSFIPWFFCLNNYNSSPSPDVPIMLLTFFVTYLMIKFFEEKDRHFLFFSLILSFYIVTIKLSALPYFLLILSIIAFCIFKSFKTERSIKNVIIITLSLFLIGIPYFIRGIISSGFIAFPSNFLNFNFKWSVPVKTAIDAEKWVKCWPRKPSDCFNSLNNWDWLPNWISQKIISEKILIFLIIIGILLIIAVFILKKNKNRVMYFIIMSISFLGSIFWFFLAPDPRFGYGYLYSFAGINISYSLYCLLYNNKNFYKIFSLIICLLFISLFSQKYIIPKQLFDYIKVPIVDYNYNITNSNNIIFVPKTGDQCFDGPLLCTPYFDRNLKIQYKNNIPRMFTNNE